MRHLAVFLLAAFPLCTKPATATTPETEAFGQCLIGKTTGDDRLLLARWITFAYTSHPSVQDAVTVDTSKLAETDQRMADLVMALLADRCNSEARAAVAAEGDVGIAVEKAFEMLGVVASQEIMIDPKVMTQVSAFAGYLDPADLTSALAP